MSPFIFTNVPLEENQKSQKEILQAFCNSLWNRTGREMTAALRINQNIPEIPIYCHPLYNEKIKALFEEFGQFGIQIGNRAGTIYPSSTYISPYRYPDIEYPLWDAFSYSLDFQYINIEKGYSHVHSFTQYGLAYYERLIFFKILLATILLEYKDHDKIETFFKHDKIYKRTLTDNSLFLSKLYTTIYQGDHGSLLRKELLISLFSYITHKTNYYRILDNSPFSKKSIFKDFFDLFLTPSISKLSLTNSKDPKDWTEENDKEIASLFIYPKMTFHTLVKGTLLIIEREGNTYLSPLFTNPTLSNFRLTENLEWIIGEKRPLNLNYYDTEEFISIPKCKILSKNEGYQYFLELDKEAKGEIKLPIVPVETTKILLKAFKNYKEFIKDPEKSEITRIIKSNQAFLKNYNSHMIVKCLLETNIKYTIRDLLTEEKDQSERAVRSLMIKMHDLSTYLPNSFFLCFSIDNLDFFFIPQMEEFSILIFCLFFINRILRNGIIILVLLLLWIKITIILFTLQIEWKYSDLLLKWIASLLLPGGGQIYSQIKPHFIYAGYFTLGTFWTRFLPGKNKVDLSKDFAKEISSPLFAEPKIRNFCKCLCEGDFSNANLYFVTLDPEEQMFCLSIQTKVFLSFSKLLDEDENQILAENTQTINDIIDFTGQLNFHYIEKLKNKHEIICTDESWFNFSNLETAQKTTNIRQQFSFQRIIQNYTKIRETRDGLVLLTAKNADPSCILFPGDVGNKADNYIIEKKFLSTHFKPPQDTYLFSQALNHLTKKNPFLVIAKDYTAMNLTNLSVAEAVKKFEEQKIKPLLRDKAGSYPQFRQEIGMKWISPKEQRENGKVAEIDANCRKLINKITENERTGFLKNREKVITFDSFSEILD